MSEPNHEQKPKTLDHVLPQTTAFTYPPLERALAHDTDFNVHGLEEIGRDDPEYARRLVALADRWADESIPEDNDELRLSVRSHLIGMGVFTYKALQRQGLADRLHDLLGPDANEIQGIMRPHLGTSGEVA